MSEMAPKRPSGGRMAGGLALGLFGFIGRFVATFIMIGIITGCIVASVLTVYILHYIEADEELNLDDYVLGYTSIVYYYDSDGNAQELQRMYNPDNNRIWVDYNQISKYTKDAVVAIEDKRFWDHEGVDWRRTFGAFAGQFMPIEGTIAGGGSTITQQLIKNITGDKDVRIDRKVREIFRAMNLSKRYTQEQILEAYLNVVPFGNGTNGIEAAANSYFGKSASELTLAESAAIVGITQFPTRYNPFLNPDQNRRRQLHVLEEMLDQGLITEREYNQARNERMSFRTIENAQRSEEVWSYFTDYVVSQVIADLREKYNEPTTAAATKRFYEGGYRVYTTVDMEIQDWLDEVYQNTDMFPPVLNREYPQSECVITDINGRIVAMQGGIGKKENSRVFNRATDSKRQPGSSIKPIATYALAIEDNRVTWSTMVEDSPINMAPPGAPPRMWPTNYYGSYSGNMTVDRALHISANTVAVKIMNVVTPQRAFDFLKNDLGLHSLIEKEVIASGPNAGTNSDIDLAPMALGALTYGVTPLEMAGAYQIFANGGNFTKPYAYDRVEDSSGRIILEPDKTPRRVISEDTAVVMNKLLQRVTAVGTGTGAAMGQIMPTAGKTGTSEHDVDQWFVGVTPYYVCQVWLGYDIPIEMKINVNTGTRQPVRNTILYGPYPPPILWNTIMRPISEKQEYKEFLESDNVVSMTYCGITGNLATGSCPSAGTGWYKKDRIPNSCSGRHGPPPGSEGDGEGGASGGGDNDGAPAAAAPAATSEE